MFLENENGNLKESISRFNKGKEIFDGMISITSTPLKSKDGIGFENAHASSSKIVNSSNPITKIYQRPSLRTNGLKRFNGNKTNHSRAYSSRGPKPRNYNHAHSHGFHNFKMKEYAKNFRCHYCGVMGTKILDFILEILIWVTQMMNLVMLTPKDPSIFGYLKCDEAFSYRCAWNP